MWSIQGQKSVHKYNHNKRSGRGGRNYDENVKDVYRVPGHIPVSEEEEDRMHILGRQLWCLAQAGLEEKKSVGEAI